MIVVNETEIKWKGFPEHKKHSIYIYKKRTNLKKVKFQVFLTKPGGNGGTEEK